MAKKSAHHKKAKVHEKKMSEHSEHEHHEKHRHAKMHEKKMATHAGKEHANKKHRMGEFHKAVNRGLKAKSK